MIIKVKVLLANEPTDYLDLFNEQEGYEVVDGDDYDLLCFTGGTDINPRLYGEWPDPHTQYPDRARDLYEQDMFMDAYRRKIPMVGICRGAQFLHAMNGYKLHQHVDGHHGNHMIYTEKETIMATSDHHQMMYSPKPTDPAEVLAWSYITERSNADPEVVWYPPTRSLSHQPHPEWMDFYAPYRRYFFETIETYLFGDK